VTAPLSRSRNFETFVGFIHSIGRAPSGPGPPARLRRICRLVLPATQQLQYWKVASCNDPQVALASGVSQDA
jgi:hypothetical protein